MWVELKRWFRAVSFVFSVGPLFFTNARGNLFKWSRANNSTGPVCALTHDGEFTGECNLKIVQNYDVTYQMKELVLLNIEYNIDFAEHMIIS